MALVPCAALAQIHVALTGGRDCGIPPAAGGNVTVNLNFNAAGTGSAVIGNVSESVAGNLNGVGTCSFPQTIGGATPGYSCTYSALLTKPDELARLVTYTVNGAAIPCPALISVTCVLSQPRSICLGNEWVLSVALYDSGDPHVVREFIAVSTARQAIRIDQDFVQIVENPDHVSYTLHILHVTTLYDYQTIDPVLGNLRAYQRLYNDGVPGGCVNFALTGSFNSCYFGDRFFPVPFLPISAPLLSVPGGVLPSPECLSDTEGVRYGGILPARRFVRYFDETVHELGVQTDLTAVEVGSSMFPVRATTKAQGFPGVTEEYLNFTPTADPALFEIPSNCPPSIPKTGEVKIPPQLQERAQRLIDLALKHFQPSPKP